MGTLLVVFSAKGFKRLLLSSEMDSRRLGRRFPQPLAAQQVAAVGITDRQGGAFAAVCGPKPALEIRTPHRIGLATILNGLLRWDRSPSPFGHTIQTVASEDLAHRALCRAPIRSHRLPHLAPQLRRSPQRPTGLPF